MSTPCTRRIPGLALLRAACAAMAVAASAASVAAPPPLQPSQASAGLSEYRQQVAAARNIALEPQHTPDEWSAANAVLVAALAEPRFAQLGKAEQAGAYYGAGWAAIRLRDYQRARDLVQKATQSDPDDADSWRWLAKLEAELGHFDAAAIALATYAGRWPQLLDHDKDFVALLVHRADPDSRARLDLLQTLFDKDWQPLPVGASDYWYQLALARIRRGETEAARAAIGRITSPAMLVRLRSDKRFDSLVDRQAVQFDVERAASRQVEQLNVQAILHPDKLELVVALARAMLADGMDGAALDLSNRALALIAATPAPPSFVDTGEQAVWLMNLRSTALYRLGRTDEALAQLEQAAKPSVDGRANINQVLNLSHFYCGLGRAEETRATAARAGAAMNGYGKLVQTLAQHCAAVLRHDKTAETQALAQLRAHRQDGQITFLLGLLRSDRMDEAAATVIELLAADSTRGEILYYLQDFLEAKPLPANAAVDARWLALLARHDVRQAVDRVGRLQHYEIFDN